MEEYEICRQLLTDIVKQAIYDYEKALMILKKYSGKENLTTRQMEKLRNAKRSKIEIEKFFTQPDFFEIYKLNGKSILSKLQERSDYGNK